MHLQNRPTYFVKDGNRRAVYYSVDARELAEAGWAVEQAVVATPEAVKTTKAEPVKVEPQESKVTETIESDEPDLDGMTRAELVEFAEANEIEFKSNASKADILEACKEFTDD
jgi:hypothetical protein